jgi:hypothetical protein
MNSRLERFRHIQGTHFRRWSADRRYLDLDWGHYSDAPPPLLFIGGSAIPEGGHPVVIVSIEPLKADHFPAQCAFAGRSLDDYHAWNLDFFDRFPGRVQIECSGVNSSDTGYFREFSWEA